MHIYLTPSICAYICILTVLNLIPPCWEGDNGESRLKIVSKQSSARPGAIIELEAIGDAIQDWQNTMLLHTFQDQVILSQGM